MQSTITTNRLHLTLVQPADAAFMLELVNTPGWLQFIGDRNVHSLEEATNYINRLINTPDLFYWVIKNKENNKAVGVVSFLKRTYLNYFDIGFALLPQYQAKGYAIEATNALLATAKTTHNKVYAICLPHNTPSVALLNKLGFSFQEIIHPNSETLHVYSKNLAI